MAATRPYPKHLAEIVKRNLTGANLGLILDKYQPWESEDTNQGWALQFRITEIKQHQEHRLVAKDSQAKGHWLACSAAPQGTRRDDPILNPNDRIDGALYLEYYQRWQATIAGTGGISFPMKNVSRLVVGLGGKGTLEMGLTLHHHAGFPWIPGSALKGLARSWALDWLAEQWRVPALDNAEFLRRQKAKPVKPTPLQKLDALLEVVIGPATDPRRLDALKHGLQDLQGEVLAGSDLLSMNAADVEALAAFQRIRAVFGGPGAAGEVIFLGGMSETKPLIVSEIMTPHFKQYYEKGNFPTDDCNPEPAVYLALETGHTFWFGISPRRQPGDPKLDPKLVEAAQHCLKMGLRELGIGAKTSSGMGLFE